MFEDLHTGERTVTVGPLTATRLARLIGLPDWERVRSLGLHPSLPIAELVALVTHDACRGVRHLSGLRAEAFVALSRCARAFETVCFAAPVAPLELPASPRLRVQALHLEAPTTACDPVFADWARSHFGEVMVWDDANAPW